MFGELNTIKKKFKNLFHIDPSFISRAPGRAEIIGNHTDYNFGFAIGAAIEQSTFSAVSIRNDNLIHTFSYNFDSRLEIFKLSKINIKTGNHWTNYVKAVTLELLKIKNFTRGFNLLIIGKVPDSGGVSSSAALEISIGLCLCKLYDIKLSNFELVLLCQKAENGPLVNSPC